MLFTFTKLHLNPVRHGTSALQVGKQAVSGVWPRPVVSEIQVPAMSVQSVLLVASHGRVQRPVGMAKP